MSETEVHLIFCVFSSSDAEPKYLVAVQPIPVNDVKKHCTGSGEPTASCLW